MDQIRLASPYDWDNLSSLESSAGTVPLTGGAGMSHLMDAITSTTSEGATAILQHLVPNLRKASSETTAALLQQQQDDLNQYASYAYFTNQVTPPQLVEPDEDDATTLSRAFDLTVSLLLNLLHQIIQSKAAGGISTKHLIRATVLTVHPAAVPSHMDAKEMVLAALLFLQQLPSSSSGYLIESTNPEADLEKQIWTTSLYSVTDDDSLKNNLKKWQLIWDTSAKGRERFCPRWLLTSPLEEEVLLRKGIIPTSVKRAAASSNSNSNKRSKQSTPQPPPMAEDVAAAAPDDDDDEDDDDEDDELGDAMAPQSNSVGSRPSLDATRSAMIESFKLREQERSASPEDVYF